MFESSIEEILKFTRPLHSISRTYGGIVSPGAATLFFVNGKGEAITCKHVAGLVPSANEIEAKFQAFKSERDKIPKSNQYKKHLAILEKKYQYLKETTVQLKNNFVNCVDRFETIECFTHPELDLAIIKFKGFSKILYESNAVFLKDYTGIKQGKYLCRVGFPFPEFNNFRHNAQNDDIEWTNTGIQASPPFPIDGIVTRFLGTIENKIGIELSTPGLKGQSGGPLFDTSGKIYGMQYGTNHLHLGFDIKNREIIDEGKKTKVSNFPFLHVGHCLHVGKIKQFLVQHNIEFTEE